MGFNPCFLPVLFPLLAFSVRDMVNLCDDYLYINDGVSQTEVYRKALEALHKYLNKKEKEKIDITAAKAALHMALGQIESGDVGRSKGGLKRVLDRSKEYEDQDKTFEEFINKARDQKPVGSADYTFMDFLLSAKYECYA